MSGRIADVAITRRLPTMHGVRGYVDAGGLMSYWANQADLYRRVVSYVDRIFKFRSAVAARDEAIVILSSPMFMVAIVSRPATVCPNSGSRQVLLK